MAETASIEEGVLYGSSVELRQSHKKISTLKRKSAGGALKPPPRPTPGSVTYTDDESDKAYDHNPDESSLTEKPSEISSSDSQVLKNNAKNIATNVDRNCNGNGTIDTSTPLKLSTISSTFLNSCATPKTPSPTSPHSHPVIQYLPKMSSVFQVSSTLTPSNPPITYSKANENLVQNGVQGQPANSDNSLPSKCWKIIDNSCYCSASSCCSKNSLRNKIFPRNTQS